METDASETDELLDDAPLTEGFAFKLERLCGTQWAKAAPAAERDFISAEWRNRVLPLLRARAIANSDSVGAYRDTLSLSWGVTEGLFHALHRNIWFEDPEDSQKPRGYWYHQPFDMFRTHDERRGFAIDKNELLEVASTYLQRPSIQTNRLDWVFLDSTVLAELEGFAHQVMTTRAGTGINWVATLAERSELKYYGYTILFWAIGVILGFVVPIALAYYLAMRGHETGAIVLLAIWALYILWKLLTYPLRFRARRRAGKLLKHLVSLYHVLSDNTISPTNWRKMLDAATADGVALDGAVFTIIDRAIARDPTAFIPMQGST